MKADAKPLNWLLGLAGAAVGGILGYVAFFWIIRQGFYALALPGLFLGLGCGLASGIRSQRLGLVCGVLGLMLGLFTEWRFEPFIANDSLSYFLTHVTDLRPITLISIVASGLLAYWCGMGSVLGMRDRGANTNTKDADSADASPPQRPASASKRT
jgi:hypothetical protein